jgi:hypothetical protein
LSESGQEILEFGAKISYVSDFAAPPDFPAAADSAVWSIILWVDIVQLNYLKKNVNKRIIRAFSFIGSQLPFLLFFSIIVEGQRLFLSLY